MMWRWHHVLSAMVVGCFVGYFWGMVAAKVECHEQQTTEITNGSNTTK